MSKKFLAAEWRKLILANYEVEASVLNDLVPPFTELDYFGNRLHVSLVGFMFRNTRVLGMKILFT